MWLGLIKVTWLEEGGEGRGPERGPGGSELHCSFVAVPGVGRLKGQFGIVQKREEGWIRLRRDAERR